MMIMVIVGETVIGIYCGKTDAHYTTRVAHCQPTILVEKGKGMNDNYNHLHIHEYRWTSNWARVKLVAKQNI